MSSIGAALGAASVSTARAEASRINGAKSRGPKTPEGKARSAQNALKHGFRAERFTVVGDEDEDAYDAHEQALLAELAPDGALQMLLAERIARAAWRLARADCIEAQLFDLHTGTDADLGLAVIRDGHGTRALDTLLRYRGAAMAELWRALRTLKALQAEARAAAAAEAPVRETNPNEPERSANPCASGEPGRPGNRANPAPHGSDPSPAARPLPQPLAPLPSGVLPRAQPVPSKSADRTRASGNPGEAAPPTPGAAGRARSWHGAGAPHA